MKILLAEDEVVSRSLLSARLRQLGHKVVAVADGTAAWQALSDPKAPLLAILDWMMPGMEGVEICRALRQRTDRPYVYVILLTSRTDKSDLIAGLDAGADDFLSKPCDVDELMSRLRVGQRILRLEQGLANKVNELKVAFEQVKQLQGFLPICMHCKRVKDQKERWQQIEQYIEEHSEAVFSHGLCTQCLQKYYPDIDDEVPAEMAEPGVKSDPVELEGDELSSTGT